MNTSAARNTETVLVVGATSSLAQAMCRELARKGYGLVLAGRDEYELEVLANDLMARSSIACRGVIIDISEAGFSASRFVEQAGEFSHAVIALGDMGADNRDDPQNIAHIMHANYIAPAQIASAIAAMLDAQKKTGAIAIISSVAGDRGRQSNYLYGSAKAALSTFASGLRNRYAKTGVHVMTVKPGFIDTPMTWGMQSPLIASREYVAQKIISAFEKKRDVIYVPWFWWGIMTIICHIPEKIFKRLSL
jgi:decaprenylphospho-beta-D-erythro-pentofuranosid-2-ulose 2-reductase